jgi:hypothetical protein
LHARFGTHEFSFVAIYQDKHAEKEKQLFETSRFRTELKLRLASHSDKDNRSNIISPIFCYTTKTIDFDVMAFLALSEKPWAARLP